MRLRSIASGLSGALAALVLALPASPIMAQSRQVAPLAAQPETAPAPTYADLVALAEASPLVVRAQVRKQAPVEPERAPGLRPGMARLYIEARTQAMLSGRGALGESLRYLVDVPLDSRGKLPSLKKQVVVLFARPVPGRVDQVQLVGRDSQLAWDPMLEQRLRAILTELAAADAPLPITGVREAIHVAGNLAGEGETQLFLTTAKATAASLVVVRSPNRPPRWGLTYSEVLPAEPAPPARDTLAWYRLACFLPPALPARANLSANPRDRAQAEADYRLVLESLGPCARTRA